MIWKDFLNIKAGELAKYFEKDIQYSRLPKSQIRQIAWREIELFVENYKHWSPEKLILKENTLISNSDRGKLNNLIKNRLKGKPLAHIIRKQRFFGIDIKVDSNVLIPRPETEELVSFALKRITNNSVLVDVGTGSGCILAAIIKNLPKDIKLAGIYAIDESRPALRLAKKNVGTRFKVNFIKSSLLSRAIGKIQKHKLFIVTNLPYLSEKEYSKLSPEVKNYEPKSALVGGRKGHELICQLVDQVINSRAQFELLLEISPTIYPKIKKHLAGKDVKYKVKRDLSGKIRILHLITNY